MKRTVVLALIAVALGWPGRASTQRPPRAAPTPGPRAWAFSFDDHHGRLGVLVNTEPNPATDSIGARLEAVTPGGPAAKAGLKAGDVITRFNGTALAGGGGGARAEDEDGSGPGRKLVMLARTLTPGDTVQVEYRRGADAKKAAVVAADVGPMMDMRGMPGMPGMDRRVEQLTVPPGMPLAFGPEGEHGFSFCFGDGWCDMELVNLNPDLGEYFGTKDGILVVKAPADSGLPLKGGDVIVAIGGRKPTSASHAMRILRSYEAGETVAIEVMRKQKRTNVTWHVPAQEDHMRHMRVRPMHSDSEEEDDQS